MPKFSYAVLASFVSLLVMGCGSSTSDRLPVASFQSSGCKSRASTPAAGDGRCVAWTVANDGTISFTLSDFAELCGVPGTLWKADASFANGDLGLSVTWDFATPNTCGSCVQDFSFVVAKVPAESVQRIRIATQGCTGDCAAQGYLLDLGTAGLATTGSFCGPLLAKL